MKQLPCIKQYVAGKL